MCKRRFKVYVFNSLNCLQIVRQNFLLLRIFIENYSGRISFTMLTQDFLRLINDFGLLELHSNMSYILISTPLVVIQYTMSTRVVNNLSIRRYKLLFILDGIKNIIEIKIIIMSTI